MSFYTGWLPEGFRYVPQDTYFLGVPRDEGFLYADSATSCVIVIAVGKEAGGEDVVALCHLSTPARIEAFFRLVGEWMRGKFTL